MLELQDIEKKIEKLFLLIDEGVEKKYRIKYCNLYFQKCNGNNLPGTYVYIDKDGYHIVYVGDRGGIVEHKTYEVLEELLFQLCWEKASSISIKYASINKESGKDWRRVMFDKILELLKRIDNNYYLLGMQIVENILLENPYNDDYY